MTVRRDPVVRAHDVSSLAYPVNCGCCATPVTLRSLCQDYRPSARNSRPAALDRWQSLLAPHVVDDSLDPRVEAGVLDPVLLGQPAPVDEIIARFLAAALFGEGDLRVRQEAAHGLRQLAEAHRDAARIIEVMARRLGQENARED